MLTYPALHRPVLHLLGVRSYELCPPSPLVYQDKYAEAEPLYERSLAIYIKLNGADHPEVALALNNWAGVLMSQVRVQGDVPAYFL